MPLGSLRSAGVRQLLFGEQWTGANNDPWNATRWPTIETGGTGGTSTVNIQSNQGRVAPQGSSATYHWARVLSGSGTLRNIDLKIEFTLSTTGEQYHALTFRHTNGGALPAIWDTTPPNDPQDGYSAMVWQDAVGGSSLSFIPVVAGIRGTIITVAKSWGTTAWNLRVQAAGSAIKLKAWQGAEPGTWDIETTNSAHASGIIGISAVNGNGITARPISWDNLVVTAT